MRPETPTEAYWKGKHVVYRLLEDGNLLYIGVTSNLPQRLQAHEQTTWWITRRRHRIDRVVAKVFPSRQEAERAEAAAIHAEAPRYNVMHNPRLAPDDAVFGVRPHCLCERLRAS